MESAELGPRWRSAAVELKTDHEEEEDEDDDDEDDCDEKEDRDINAGQNQCTLRCFSQSAASAEGALCPVNKVERLEMPAARSVATTAERHG